jgi:hypothetical protein
MFGNREVCIGVSVTVKTILFVQIMQLVANFVKRFTGPIDMLVLHSYSLPSCNDQS